MILDSYGFIVMEQTAFPGSIGDSLAETARHTVLLAVIGNKPIIDLTPFITDKGLLRHPQSPWREDDTSLDQMYPLLAAASVTNSDKLNEIEEYITKNHTSTYNGIIINPGMWAQISRAKNENFLWIGDLCILAQALIFKFSLSSETANYLNFVNGLAFAKIKGDTWPCKLAKWLTPKEKVLEKVKSYYLPEPRSQWIIDLYIKALDRIY